MTILAYHFFGVCVLLLLLVLAPFRPRWREGLRQRLGMAPVRWRTETGDLVWVHGASVGEVMAAAPLIEALLADRPTTRVLVSTTTITGRRVAEEKLGDDHPRVGFTLLPLDVGGLPARVVRRERPGLFILLETELWPVLLITLRRAGIPVLIANGRISQSSYGRYRAVRRFLRPALEACVVALMRTPEDARRFEGLGLPAERIRVVGNLKHAARDPRAGEDRRGALQLRLGIATGRPVLVAGSLRGLEQTMVLSVFRRLLTAHPRLLLVLAPRHPDRFEAHLLRGWPGAWVRWSAAPERIAMATTVVVLDTLGALSDFYGTATVACVGGTWGRYGGHNLLEPAFYGVPVVFGPDFRNFDDEGRALLAAGGGFLAAGGEELYQHCRRLLEDQEARAETGRRAAVVATSFGGAVEKTIAAVREILGHPDRTGP